MDITVPSIRYQPNEKQRLPKTVELETVEATQAMEASTESVVRDMPV